MRGILALLFLYVILHLADGHHFSAIRTCHEHSLSRGVLGVKLLGVAAFLLSGIGSTFSGSAAVRRCTVDTGPNKPLHWMHRPGSLGSADEELYEENDTPRKGHGLHSSSGGSSSYKKGQRLRRGSGGTSSYRNGQRPGFNFRGINLPKRGSKTNLYGGRSNLQRKGYGEGANNGGGVSSIKASAYDVLYEANGTPKRDMGYNVTYERKGSPRRAFGYDASYEGSPFPPKRGTGLKLGSGINIFSDRGPGGKTSTGANSFSESGPGGSAISSATVSSNLGPGGQTTSTVSAFSNSGFSNNSAVCG